MMGYSNDRLGAWMDGMMAGMGLVWLLGTVALILLIAALVKYLFFGDRG